MAEIHNQIDEVIDHAVELTKGNLAEAFYLLYVAMDTLKEEMIEDVDIDIDEDSEEPSDDELEEETNFDELDNELDEIEKQEPIVKKPNLKVKGGGSEDA